MQMHANAGGDAYETPRHGRIKVATKDKSEYVPSPLTLKRTHKRSPSHSRLLVMRWSQVNAGAFFSGTQCARALLQSSRGSSIDYKSCVYPKAIWIPTAHNESLR